MLPVTLPSPKIGPFLCFSVDSATILRQTVGKVPLFSSFKPHPKNFIPPPFSPPPPLRACVSCVGREKKKKKKNMFSKTTTLQQPKRETKGGLVRKDSGERSSSSSSVLGLDKLAERKREAKKEEERKGLSEFKVPGKRKRGDGDGDDETPHFISRDHKSQKHFRRSREETPSRGDGVNEDALDRIQNKEVSRRHPQNDNYRSNSRRPSDSSYSSSSSSSWDAPSPRRDGGSSWEDVTPKRNRWDMRSPHPSSTPAGSHEVVDTPRNFTPSWKSHWDGDREGGGKGRRETGQRGGGTGRRDTGRRETGREEYQNSKEYEKDFERQYYNNEGAAAEDNPDKAFLGSRDKWKERETEMEKRQMERLSAKRQAMNQDNKLWEENRLMLSGVASKRTVELEFDDDTEARVHLLVHDIKPPFLDGRIVFTKQQEAVLVVKDPTSDIATLSKKGSQVLRELREKKDRMKSRKKYWELAGSRVGKAVDKDKYGKTDEELQKEGRAPTPAPGGEKGEEVDGDHVDYRKSAGFSGHLETMSSEAVSHFAKSKTLREQREFLPIFKVKKYLMNVIRENQIVVIVGQTGSGE